ncbi:hypothetical protein AAC387_Pa03g0220 [Persea americana]
MKVQKWSLDLLGILLLLMPLWSLEVQTQIGETQSSQLNLKMMRDISKHLIAHLLLEEDGICSIEPGDSELNMPAFMSTTEAVQVDKEIDLHMPD